MSETYRNFQTESITWRGVNATYSLAEIDEVEGLPAREAWVIHTLKSLGGEIVTGNEPPVNVAVWDERRNSSRVFPVEPGALDAAKEALRDHKKGLVPRKRNEPLPGSISLF